MTVDIPVRPSEELLTEAEVAEILGMKEKTLTNRRYKKQPVPPYVKVGDVVKYRRTALDAWILEQENN